MTAKSFFCVPLCGLLLAVSSSAVPLPDPDDDPSYQNLPPEEWDKVNLERTEQHLKAWTAAKGDERLKQAGALAYYAWRAERHELIERVIADDLLAETEVKIPAGETAVHLEVKHEALVDRTHEWPSAIPPIWRRITPASFEIWTPSEGWLFNSRGALLHTAKPPRTDGRGREWFGAFLPDGHWITTDLGDWDRRVHVFNAEGRLTREIKAGTLVPDDDPGDLGGSSPIIPWARSDRTGKAWVVRVGSEGGRDEMLLKPDGSSTRIKASSSPWRHCLPRQLGVRHSEGVSFYMTQSDDGKVLMESQQPSHGMGVGNPNYAVYKDGAGKDDPAPGPDNIPSSGRVFGFWPGSHATYVQGTTRTWFFDAAGNYQGWINGRRVGDGATGKDMLFAFADGRIVAVSPDLKARLPQRFTLPDGTAPPVLELHPDLGLGIFALPKQPVDGEPEEAKEDDSSVEAMGETGNWLDGRRGIVLARWAVEAAKSKQ